MASVERLRELIRSCDAVVIGAGAAVPKELGDRALGLDADIGRVLAELA